ncbi:hypothetical protein BDV95DRAFT_609301 [Massariosphaeria phaeospora]|uniref:Myb-like domain-containing protein n=1 Tax=Massariosphaeria phaeospora TaxID=100035 RepID=A0A7C8I2E1_9PLEO|nr:hypothetical protein BDV95DRAFT_609301 [Massariosphaeria phaeospora]
MEQQEAFKVLIGHGVGNFRLVFEVEHLPPVQLNNPVVGDDMDVDQTVGGNLANDGNGDVTMVDSPETTPHDANGTNTAPLEVNSQENIRRTVPVADMLGTQRLPIPDVRPPVGNVQLPSIADLQLPVANVRNTAKSDKGVDETAPLAAVPESTSGDLHAAAPDATDVQNKAKPDQGVDETARPAAKAGESTSSAVKPIFDAAPVAEALKPGAMIGGSFITDRMLHDGPKIFKKVWDPKTKRIKRVYLPKKAVTTADKPVDKQWKPFAKAANPVPVASKPVAKKWNPFGKDNEPVTKPTIPDATVGVVNTGAPNAKVGFTNTDEPKTALEQEREKARENDDLDRADDHQPKTPLEQMGVGKVNESKPVTRRKGPFRTWTQTEDQKMIGGWLRNETARAIADSLPQRTVIAVSSRIAKMKHRNILAQIEVEGEYKRVFVGFPKDPSWVPDADPNVPDVGGSTT